MGFLFYLFIFLQNKQTHKNRNIYLITELSWSAIWTIHKAKKIIKPFWKDAGKRFSLLRLSQNSQTHNYFHMSHISNWSFIPRSSYDMLMIYDLVPKMWLTFHYWYRTVAEGKCFPTLIESPEVTFRIQEFYYCSQIWRIFRWTAWRGGVTVTAENTGVYPQCLVFNSFTLSEGSVASDTAERKSSGSKHISVNWSVL